MADMEFKSLPQILEGLKEYIDSSIFGYTQATDDYYKAVCSWMERRHSRRMDC
jgi:bifunctional pyridoxal-dependent enzyme with beta-cystathionase and maltose regulon repressor activities